MKKNPRKVIESASDVVTDTALILQRVGVVCNDYQELDNAVHSFGDIQKLINHAADLFFNRKQQGLITLGQLLGTLQEAA